jgi:hypothetical protein
MFGRFKPARSKVEVKVLVDLDRLISESVGFMLHGEVRRIKPITQETFLYVINELAALDLMRQGKVSSLEELRVAYLALFKKACEPFNDDDLKKMTDAQIGALVQKIIDCVRGTAQASGEKKTLLIK